MVNKSFIQQKVLTLCHVASSMSDTGVLMLTTHRQSFLVLTQLTVPWDSQAIVNTIRHNAMTWQNKILAQNKITMTGKDSGGNNI